MSKCKVCKGEYEKKRPFETWCSIDCGVALALQKKASQEAKNALAERKLTRERLDKLKTRAQWIKEAQQAFNKYIRERDRAQRCICCDRAETEVKGLGAHGWDAGHYRSTGSAPHLRFSEDNCHRQLVYCNRYRGGNAVDYRVGLIKRIGLERVEALEADQTPRKWSIEELKQIKETYKRKAKELANALP